ncbi:hypothetical protein QRD02_00780 [Aequorivita sp. SDUM287046]|uniref:NlpE C-terminal OB domain-containing protein n=1 Tax=Aequorivita aurantiaca TaxID=3053356 RepID=A0ABT8DG65_9FLAO|nr:hypothetical protein [Aequorivita aurantiaca]MDN3722901.1 hypothetical protein [Aequorivita aurantiaca]
MKKIILLFMLSAAIFSCKNSEDKNKETQEVTSEITEKSRAYKGEFLNADGAMVFMGPNFIYAVKRDIMSEGLSKQVAPIKKNEQDMVGVIIKGTISKNTEKESEWEEMITITEIMRVDDKPSEVDIKLNESEKKN